MTVLSTIENLVFKSPKRFACIGVFSVVGLGMLSVTSCKKDDDDHPTPTVNLSLIDNTTNNGVLSANFDFPVGHRQSLTAPKDHELAGAAITTEFNAFDHDLVIQMQEGVGFANSRTAKALTLQSAFSSAGPAVLIQAKGAHLDASQPMEITIPVKLAKSDPQQNLTILYHVMQEGVGGRNAIGLMKVSQLVRTEQSITFRSSYFGRFQAVYYSGDPAAIAEARTSEGFYGLADDAAKNPDAFMLQTPSGQITSAYPVASWSSATRAAKYDMVVAKNKDCSGVVLSYEGITTASHVLEGLPDGKYFSDAASEMLLLIFATV